MRLALVSLIAIGGFAPLAQAQTPAQLAPSEPPMSAAPAMPATPPAPPETPAPAPPAPPAPPTDPTAIALLSAIEQICIPSTNGGDMAKLAKAAGYRKSGDNFVLKQPGFQFTVLAPGSNPSQCHIDLTHPIDPEAPAKPLVIALHNWAVFGHGWSLYRNDKNVDAGQEFTTRSWEHTADGKSDALVLTTVRKADGSPTTRNADTSMVIYSSTKTPG